MTRCNYKYGLEKSNKLIFTHTVPRLDAKKFHVIERITTLLKLTGNEFGKEELKIDYHPAESSIMKIKELLENLYDIKRFLIGINISAGSDARFWGIENYKLLVSKLKEFDINLILICHDKDYLKAKEIIDDKFILNPTKNFDLFAAVIQNLDLLFSPDTSAVFLADAKRIPVFELVVKYRTDEVIWHPFNSDCDFIITKEPTLRNIKFEEVWNKFRPFLQKHLNLRK
jgi:ADP-heptose:LPS heptosyltransferase